MLEHRRTLVAARTLMLHHVADQILRAAHRGARPAHHRRQDRSPAAPPRRDRPRHSHDPRRQTSARLAAGVHRPGPRSSPRDPPPRTSHRRAARRPRHHPARRARRRPHRRCDAAVRGRRPDPVRPRIEVRPLVPPPAPSPCPRARAAATRSSTGSTSEATGASTQCCTSRRSPSSAPSPKRPPTSPAKPAKAKPDAKPDEPTNANSPTASSAECGATKPPETSPSRSPLDKGASDRPIAVDRDHLDCPFRCCSAGCGAMQQQRCLVAYGDSALGSACCPRLGEPAALVHVQRGPLQQQERQAVTRKSPGVETPGLVSAHRPYAESASARAAGGLRR